MSQLQVESGIPVPEKRSFANKGYTAVVRKLVVGQSVLLPTSYGAAHSIAAALTRSEFARGSFVVRKAEGGARIWRVDPAVANGA